MPSRLSHGWRLRRRELRFAHFEVANCECRKADVSGFAAAIYFCQAALHVTARFIVETPDTRRAAGLLCGSCRDFAAGVRTVMITSPRNFFAIFIYALIVAIATITAAMARCRYRSITLRRCGVIYRRSLMWRRVIAGVADACRGASRMPSSQRFDVGVAMRHCRCLILLFRRTDDFHVSRIMDVGALRQLLD